MSTIKLTYFNTKGLGETIRYLLKYGNIEFEDVRLEKDNWPALKASTPFGQLPLYEEDGKVAYQSIAIARYVAKKVKLSGDTDWENLEIDAIVDTFTDLRQKISPLFSESDPEKKEVLKQSLLNETIPFYLERLEKSTTQNNGYLAANKLTWADIYFTSVVDLFIRFIGVNLLENYTGLSNLKNEVEEIPEIKDWIAVRPVTPF